MPKRLMLLMILQRENALTSGKDYYLDKMYLLYECKAFSFKYISGKINL